MITAFSHVFLYMDYERDPRKEQTYNSKTKSNTSTKDCEMLSEVMRKIKTLRIKVADISKVIFSEQVY